jgi:hypothetical protein
MYDSVFAEILSGKSCHIGTVFGGPWPQNMTVIVDVSLLGALFVIVVLLMTVFITRATWCNIQKLKQLCFIKWH